MIIKQIDAKMLQKLFLAGAKNLEAKKEIINDLNVFPVPDGDTGTNMSLTILAAAKEVSQLDNPDIKTIAKAISSGSLRGARGNSGVILSQLFRGFTREIGEHSVLDTTVLANALHRATETAYKAVMKPKEGTILTVAKGAAEKATQIAANTNDIAELMRETIAYAEYVLSQTPEMLPVLKQAGVVDAGGQGLIEILKGAYDALLGKEVDLTITAPTHVTKAITPQAHVGEEIEFGYCTEFIVLLQNEADDALEVEFKQYLETIGDSIVVVADDKLVKVHVHTNDPGLAIQKGLSKGDLTGIKIDNMREQHQEKVIHDVDKILKAAPQETEAPSVPVERKEVGFIAVSIGEGINEIFKGLGVDYIIEGGQTMNPSTEDMLNAIANIHADNIFILPNNKNIILAAEQAKELVEDKNIIVIPSKTIPQGISAVINYVQGKQAEENAARMTEEMSKIKTGQVTYAVRDTNIEDKEIKQGDILGIGDSKILAVDSNPDTTLKALLQSLVDEDSELISVYYGADVSNEDAERLKDYIEANYSDCDVEIHYGGQPLYYYILSVE